MNDSTAFIELALNMLSCSQKELATRLNVSPTQISKWKKGEHMSSDMADKFRALLKIGELDPGFIVQAGSLEDAAKWEKLIHFLAEMANENSETGYDTPALSEEEDFLCWQTFDVLNDMGVALPKGFPKDLDIEYEGDDDEQTEVIWDTIESNPHSALIYQIYKALTDVYGFYAAYIAELINDDELEIYSTSAMDIESCLMSLAASKIEVDQKFARKFRDFEIQIKKDYVKWIIELKDKAFRAGAPLRAELLDLVHDGHDDLGHDAERESLGFNKSRLHPDIYMNELLVGMRIVHQALPLIMKKLEIYDEFQLDESKLRL